LVDPKKKISKKKKKDKHRQKLKVQALKNIQTTQKIDT